jgi:hypothetical protein
MSANAIGKYLPFSPDMRPRVSDRPHQRERRASVRTALHWPVLLRHKHLEPLESVTENLSSQGFYCLAQTPLTSGETLQCWLTVPTHDPSGVRERVVLECTVRVIRSEAAPINGLFGIACRIEDYHFAAPESALP